ncbi:substrate-binding domain-containing protein [Leucobacter sp. CSA1]|uniref:Substrate-binding domain-containing protein n=1 Tax=Leucobacter chromiisoli TaxID=2796471 RepID=A0A934UUE9_9MICO|nr:substrate-binding domain-containing protein [Leucobacter chromiisoli]MBK0418356.1 substrate-binding domain-containing protein [Leucobacter chromiisoli]
MTPHTRSPAVARAAAILRLLAASPAPQTVASIVQATALPKTSVLGICRALADERLLARGANGSYALGPRVAEFAAAARLTAEQSLKFGLLIPTRDNEYYTALIEAAEEAMQEAGGELIVLQADEDPDRQQAQWQELLDLGADVVLIDSVDSDALGRQLRHSQRADVPVVAVGSRMSGVNASVSSDNTQAGLLAGRFLASRLGPGAKVAVVDGLRKNANADRVAGFREALLEFSGVELVAHIRGDHDNPEAGGAAMHRALDEHPDLAGAFAVCDPIAFGASEVARGAGRPIPIASVDGRARAIDQITGAGPIVATAAQDPARIIRTALDIARNLCRGVDPPQGTVLIPVRLITEQNAGGYTPWL